MLQLSREPPAGPSSPLTCPERTAVLSLPGLRGHVQGTVAVRGVAPLLTCAMGQARVQEPGALP